jgi:prepilin-type N-terminal cleavage/methylation domain-containing protein
MKYATDNPPRSRQAFTLVEILVVVIILGIAAAVIVPEMGTRGDLKAAAAARMIMADLIYAQNRAIATQTRHYVKFDASSNPQTYRLLTSVTPLVDVQHPISKASNYLVTFGSSSGATPGLSDISLGTVSFEGRTTLAFDELGVPYYYDPGTNTTTALATTGGSTIQVKCGTFTLTVTVEPYTGEIKVN